MDGFPLTGLTALARLCISKNNAQDIVLFVLTVGICRRFPLAKLCLSFPES